MSVMSVGDSTKLMELKERLEAEIAKLKGDVKDLDRQIAAYEKEKGHFATGMRRDRERLHERLTDATVCYDQCWPNPWFVLQTLQRYFQEVPLH